MDGLLGVILGEAVGPKALAIAIAFGGEICRRSFFIPPLRLLPPGVAENTYDLTLPR